MGSALVAVREYVLKEHPNAFLAILAGSVVRGESTETSDLDIVIINEGEEPPYRKSVIYQKWPIELFVYNQKAYKEQCQREVEKAKPFLLTMILEGIPIIDRDKNFHILKREGEEILKKGPRELSPKEIDNYRYTITTLLEDLKGSENHYEGIFIVNKLSMLLAEFIMRLNRRWIGDGKWAYKLLKEFDEEIADKFTESFSQFYSNDNKEHIIRFTEEILVPVGGLLFEGIKKEI
ncbi:Nucleotidyltransferase domain-containing protein [Anaerobranca californiensis DSM 14826]|jgi:predicted nucleotidyltransferase|uniref:Nucleotidyltransferase domain-containing protein n=1 Tax=Anaerobranca californiensis DSM 14826 TaxID=1120989 RepID=A0A1M6MMN4_9FIRM|nr:nucleotidyltransferase domain-containing protein [Anaerobranca californiensis]SHJ84533.1 Nucleotidyltransferase domain-containing protein [Anaerobranca californiensis DSM 14826]